MGRHRDDSRCPRRGLGEKAARENEASGVSSSCAGSIRRSAKENNDDDDDDETILELRRAEKNTSVMNDEREAPFKATNQRRKKALGLS